MRDLDLVDLLRSLQQPWRGDALCMEHPGVNFYPERGESAAEAKAVCERCAVRVECLEFALDDPDALRHGIWGGTSARERRALGRVPTAA